MFLAQTALGAARFAAFFEGAGSVSWTRHFAGFPEAIVLAAVALRDYFAFTIVGFAGSFRRHRYFLS
jgi:hypothetical protein